MRTAACLPVLAVGVLVGCIEESDQAAPGGRPPTDARPHVDVRRMNDGHVEPRDATLASDVALLMDADPEDARSVRDAREVPSPDRAVESPDAASLPDATPDVARPMLDECFGMLLDGAPFVADYAVFDPVIGRHCRGTDHQAIVDVEQVVFVGDALATGSAQEQIHLAESMRVQTAIALAEHYGSRPPAPEWYGLDPLTGRPALRRSGDFIACADPLAEVSDLLDGPRILADCLLPEERERRTLFIVTVGIKDVKRLTGMLAEGAEDGQILSAAGQSVDALERALRWMKDPARFPAGSFVVFSNVPDWTDGRGDTAACRGWPALPNDRQRFFGRMLAHINGQYMRIAVEQDADLVFMQEQFCGHGIHFRQPDPLCLGMPERWIQRDCRFLNPEGDAALARLFWAVITDSE